MPTTSKRGYYYPAATEQQSEFPSPHGKTMGKIDTDMNTALTAVITAGRVPNLPASKITTGTLGAGRLPEATTKLRGAMSPADKTKLDGLKSSVGAGQITDATEVGKAVLTAADAAAARTAIGAGTSSQTLATGEAKELTAGTGTTGRAWTAKVIADYVATHGGGGGSPVGAWVVGTPQTPMVASSVPRLRYNHDETFTVAITGYLSVSTALDSATDYVIATWPANPVPIDDGHTYSYAKSLYVNLYLADFSGSEWVSIPTALVLARESGTERVELSMTFPPGYVAANASISSADLYPAPPTQ